jgi:hypothetical protein
MLVFWLFVTDYDESGWDHVLGELASRSLLLFCRLLSAQLCISAFVGFVNEYVMISASFTNWIYDSCTLFWREVQWKKTDFFMWLLREFVRGFETCYFFQIIAGFTWFFVAFTVNEVALEQVSLLVFPVFLCWSPFHYWCLLSSTVRLDVQ